jgi:CBS domain-containing protein
MKLIQLCKRPVVSIDAQAPLREAARLMRLHHVGALVVTHVAAQGVQVTGLVTDRDLVVDGLARGLDPDTAHIGLVAAQRVIGAPADAGIEEAAELLQREGVRRLVVYTPEGELAGIVSFDDVFGACAHALAGLAAGIARGQEREAQLRADVPVPPPVRIPALGTLGWQLGASLANP